MSKRLFLLTICIEFFCNISFAQFRKKNLEIHSYYTIFNHDNLTIKCRRTEQSEFPKLQKIDNELLTRILKLENGLQQMQHGIIPTEQTEKYERAVLLLKSVLDRNRLTFDITEYEQEFLFYKQHPIKSPDQIIKEKIARADSMDIIRENQKKERAAEMIRMDEKRNSQYRYNDSVKLAEENTRIRVQNEKINDLKKNSTFPFDSLALIDILTTRMDSLQKSGQSIKAERVGNKIYEIQNRLFSNGRVYIFQVIKQNGIFSYSYESEAINIFSNFYYGYIIRENIAKYNHNLPSWITSDNIIEAYEAIKKGQTFRLKIKLLPSKFSHTFKGHKCNHDFNENRCQIISIN